jgi:chromosome segregation ATPase
MNATPETDAMASIQRTHQEWRAHSETLERDRDEWKEEAELREKKSDVWKHEAEILREELKKADDVLESNIETFLDLREERDEWKSRFTDAVERLEGKLHCVEGCKCSGRREVNMLREILQGNADASTPSERKTDAQ